MGKFKSFYSENKTFVRLLVGCLVLLALFVGVATLSGSWPGSDAASQILSALSGAVVAAIITLFLLLGQTSSEEKKERNIKVYENKIQVYSEFISKMWKTLEDDEITDEEIRGIRSDIFNKLIFYLKKDDIVKLAEKVRSIKSSEGFNDGEEDEKRLRKRTKETIECFSEITELLRADVNNDLQTESEMEINRLWNNFGVQPRDSVTAPDKIKVKDETGNQNTETTAVQTLNYGFWHFAMLGAEEQIGALRNGIYELNLIEYGEEWRTNLLKQVRKNDLVFLFRSGGWGYMGVFRALGWRVFEFLKHGKVKETVQMFGKPIETITEEKQIVKDLKRSDIYNSKEDGADFCSSLIVEPLAFAKNGIGNPGGVYRRTISRYDHNYGIMQLARFMAIMDDPDNYDVHDNGETTVKMGCNKEKFMDILKSGNIKPAARDEKGNWK